MSPTPISDAARRRQEGFTLAGLIVILTIISIVVAFTVPEQWSMVMGRERDRQTIFLMKQYARGIRAWSQKHSAMPTSLDQLADARRPRYLRGDGKWPCPLTGNVDDWILVPPSAIDGGQGVPITNPSTAPDNAPSNPNQAGEPTKLRSDMSPKDYVGPFVAVRPNAKGKSYVAFKNSEDYGDWVYTVQDLEAELAARAAALNAK